MDIQYCICRMVRHLMTKLLLSQNCLRKVGVEHIHVFLLFFKAIIPPKIYESRNLDNMHMDIPSKGLCESLVKIVKKCRSFLRKTRFNYLYVFNCENKPNIILLPSFRFDNANYIRIITSDDYLYKVSCVEMLFRIKSLTIFTFI